MFSTTHSPRNPHTAFPVFSAGRPRDRHTSFPVFSPSPGGRVEASLGAATRTTGFRAARRPRVVPPRTTRHQTRGPQHAPTVTASPPRPAPTRHAHHPAHEASATRAAPPRPARSQNDPPRPLRPADPARPSGSPPHPATHLHGRTARHNILHVLECRRERPDSS